MSWLNERPPDGRRGSRQRLPNHITVSLSSDPLAQTSTLPKECAHPNPEQPELQPRHHAAKMAILVRYAAPPGEEAPPRDSPRNIGADRHTHCRQLVDGGKHRHEVFPHALSPQPSALSPQPSAHPPCAMALSPCAPFRVRKLVAHPAHQNTQAQDTRGRHQAVGRRQPPVLPLTRPSPG
jgi:hypothetical protein